VARGSMVRRVALPTVASGIVTTALAIAINVATDGRYGVWAWVAVGALTIATLVVSLWLNARQNPSPDPVPDRVHVGGNVDVRADNQSVAALAIDTVNMGGGPSTATPPQAPGQQGP